MLFIICSGREVFAFGGFGLSYHEQECESLWTQATITMSVKKSWAMASLKKGGRGNAKDGQVHSTSCLNTKVTKRCMVNV